MEPGTVIHEVNSLSLWPVLQSLQSPLKLRLTRGVVESFGLREFAYTFFDLRGSL